MTLLILEMLLALAVIVGIMVWTLKTRTDTPVDALEKPDQAVADADASAQPSAPDKESR